MFQKSRGSSSSIEVDGSTHSNAGGGAAAAAAAAAAAVEDRGKGKGGVAATSTARRVSLPALSWSMAWTSSAKGLSNGQANSSNKNRKGKGKGKGKGQGKKKSPGETASPHTFGHGITDFRLIPRWSFFTQPLREPEERMKTSIGKLYVKVVEGRGLMSSDLNGRSDPYAKLCLTGRYLSTGQEWSEKLRLRDTTKTIKYSLNPVWNEEFSMPVRRSGAVLKIEVWDWDRSSSDDPLGHFEVSIGEELLSQQPLDMWYVLEAPRGKAAAAQAAAEKKLRRQQAKGNSNNLGFQGGDADGAHVSFNDDDVMGETDIGTDHDNDGDNDDDNDNDNDDDDGPDSPVGLGDSSIGHSSGSGSGHGIGFSTSSLREGTVSSVSSVSSKLVFGRRSSSMGNSDHSHESEEERRACEICIERRRKLYGEVRLVLWYQFDEFAEMCSHTWPEEPLKPGKTHFSPNELYRKGMVCWQMAQPYVNFMKEADAILCWGRPWRSLMWMIALVAMLVVPPILIVVLNAALMRIVVLAYIKHRCGGGETCGNGTSAANANGPAAAPAAAAAAAPHGQGGGLPTSSSSPSIVGSWSSHPHPPAAATGMTDASGHSRRDGSLGALASSSGETGRLSAPVSPAPGGNGRRRSSSEILAFSPAACMPSWPPSPTPNHSSVVGGGASAGHGEGLGSNDTADGGSADGGGGSLTEASGDPSIVSSARSQPRGSKRFQMFSRRVAAGTTTTTTTTAAPRSAPPSSLTTPSTTGPSTSFFTSAAAPPAPVSPVPSRASGFGGGGGGPNGSANGNAHVGLHPSRMRAAGAVARGGVMSAAGAGGMKIKNLLPTRRDPELQELYERLGSTKKVPAVVNEVGKRLLSKSGPGLQLGLEKMGRNLIQIRQRFHPLQVKELVLAITALALHMLFQLWLYLTGRFNLYFALLVVGQFFNKLYKRWGKAFVMAVKEARRSYRARQALAHRMSAAAAAAAAVACASPSPATARDGRVSSSVSEEAGAISAVEPNPFKFDAANPPAFAPPGATPAMEPYPYASLGGENANAARQASSSFFARSPARGKKSNSGGSSGSSSSTASEFGGDSHYSSRGGGGGGGGLLTPRGRRGSVPSPGATTPSASPARSRSIKSEGAASEVSHSVRGGGGKSRRWSAPWGKRLRISGGGGRGGSFSGGGMPRFEEDEEVEGDGDGGGLSSPVLPPPRLRSHGHGHSHGGRKPGRRRRVRWARVLAASSALLCVVSVSAAAVSAYFFPGDGRLGSPSPFPPLIPGATGLLGLLLRGRGVNDFFSMMPGTEMVTAWRSGLEQFGFGERGGVEGNDEGAPPDAETLLQ